MTQEQLSPETQAKLRKLMTIRNVVGYQKKIVPRIQDDGTTVDEEVIQVIVSQKIPVAELRDDDIIPKEIDGIPVNVVDNKGHPKIFNTQPAPDGEALSVIPHQENHRPLLAGISIGNYKITAGTLGWFYENPTMFPEIDYLIGSNAHVLTDHPEWDIPGDTRIIQRGKADGGTLADMVADYAWHQKIYPDSGYLPVPEPTWLQKLCQLFGLWKPPAPIPSGGINNIDFAVAYPHGDIDYVLNTLDFNPIDLGYKLGSHLFAGGGLFTIGCKMEYIEALGFNPVGVETTNFEFGNQGRKSGRTTGDIQRYCAGESAVMKVSYGNFIGIFDDVCLFNDMSDGGDSGAAIWKTT